MRKFSVRPTLTLKGRTFKGLRGWSGKPLHPPLTDFPIVAYVLAAVFDVLSAVAGKDHTWARELWHAGTYLFIGGAAVSVLAAVEGLEVAAPELGHWVLPIALAAGWFKAWRVAAKRRATMMHGHWVIPGGAMAATAAREIVDADHRQRLR